MEAARSGLRAPYIAKSKSSEMLFPAFFMEHILEKKTILMYWGLFFKLQTYAFLFLLQKPTNQQKKHFKNKGKI